MSGVCCYTVPEGVVKDTLSLSAAIWRVLQFKGEVLSASDKIRGAGEGELEEIWIFSCRSLLCYCAALAASTP